MRGNGGDRASQFRVGHFLRLAEHQLQFLYYRRGIRTAYILCKLSGNSQLLCTGVLSLTVKRLSGNILICLIYAGKGGRSAYGKRCRNNYSGICYAGGRKRIWIHISGAPCNIACCDVHPASLRKQLHIHTWYWACPDHGWGDIAFKILALFRIGKPELYDAPLRHTESLIHKHRLFACKISPYDRPAWSIIRRRADRQAENHRHTQDKRNYFSHL